MAIPITEYVDITSGVGAAESVAERQLITRCFDDNLLIPPQSYVEFTSADEVGNYFGTSSLEYLRAEFYFGWISKNITQAPKISFARWVDVAVAASIYGADLNFSLGNFTGISNGALNLSLAGFTHQLTGISLTGAGSLGAVAMDIQNAIQGYVAGGADWTAATVTYDAVRGSFDFKGGVAGPEALAVNAASTGTDLAVALGWNAYQGAIIGQGSAVETVPQTLSTSYGLSNNFGSFLFMPTATSFSVADIEAAALWNTDQNNDLMYLVPVTAANAATVAAGIGGYAGCAMTLTDPTDYPNDFDEMAPGMILAATDYQARKSVQNYMFQIFDLNPKVTTLEEKQTYDTISVNYYGQTQQAGQFISFYQNGVLTGLPVDPLDQNTYANEIWLKDAAASSILTLQLALPNVSADTEGKGQITAQLQTVVSQALFNGTISVGKPLTQTQKSYITNATGDNTAWQQVQSSGYWLDVEIVPETSEAGVVSYIAEYTLIYSKDDIIRFVQGTHVLI